MTVSQNVINSIGNNVTVAFIDAGEKRLKNIARPVRTYRWLPTGQGAIPRAEPATVRKPSAWLPWAFAILFSVAVVASGLWLHGPLSPPSATVPTSPTAGQGSARAYSPDRPGIAVLPFINQSGDASQEYFSEGLTEDVIVALGRFPSLTVMSRSAVFPYKGRNVPPAEIGRELGVRYLVQASVRRAGERIRLSAQLVEAASGKLLWSQEYDGDLRDVFALQDAIARNVGGALAVNLTRVEQQRALAKPPDDLDAYDLMLRGRESMWLGTRAGNREARRLFERAIAMDPRYASAYAWLGRGYLEMAELGWTDDPGVAVDRAFDLTRKALSLNPDDVEALSVMGYAQTMRGEYDLAFATSDRLLAINPSDADAMFGRLSVLLWLGRIDEAVAIGEQAFRFNPNPRVGSVFALGLAYYEAKRHADAVRVLERGGARFPDASFLFAALAAAYAQLNRLPEAAQALEALSRVNPFFDIDTAGSRFQNPAHQAYLREGLVKAGWR